MLDHVNKTVEPATKEDMNLTAQRVANWTVQKEILISNFSDDFAIRKEIDQRKALIAKTLLRPCVGCTYCGKETSLSFYQTKLVDFVDKLDSLPKEAERSDEQKKEAESFAATIAVTEKVIQEWNQTQIDNPGQFKDYGHFQIMIMNPQRLRECVK